MKPLFNDPKVGDKVILTMNNVESNQVIISVGSCLPIRISGMKHVSFGRDGTLSKNSDPEGKMGYTIRPI
jgi:hypothetical protein